MPDRQLETERLILRRLTLDDARFMLGIWNDPAFIRNVGDRGIRTEEQAVAALQTGALSLYAEYGYGPYVMVRRSDGTEIGICGLFKRENLADPDIGFGVLPEYCGQGYASEAAFEVLAHTRDVLGIDNLAAIVSPENAPSIALIEKLGLRFDRKFTMPGDDEAVLLYSRNHSRE
jgi:RimJ/RimL family protein N-acetyltransferase